MLVDVGGTYKDLEEDEDYIRVIQNKTSYEFADIIRNKLSDQDERFIDLEIECDMLRDHETEMRDVLNEINSLVQNAIYEIEKMPRMDRKKIIQYLNGIENEADNYI